MISFFQTKVTLADENRAHFRDQQWKGIRIQVIRATAVGGIAFMLWFLACVSYMFGSVYMSPSRQSVFKVLAVNYDGGVIGQSVEVAYQQLRGPEFFTLEYHTAEEYRTMEDMYEAVWKGDYWAAVSVSENASSRLAAALQGGDAASSYNASDAMHYVWNQQYYTTFANSVIQSHMIQLIAATRLAYNKMNGALASSSLNITSPAAVIALLNPIQATSTNIMAATFGTTILLNTVSMVMPILQQFFFLLVLNGVLAAHQVYKKMTVRSSLVFRRVAGILFTFGAALCQTGYFWAFRDDWAVKGNQFVLTWLTLWLLMHIHLLMLDSVSTLAPMPAMPFVVILWVLINVSSTVSPLEAQPGFYHWGVALPSHEAYSILVTIWTGGAHNRLYRALPILFSWWVAANATTSLTHIRACHLAYRMDLDQIREGEGTAAAQEKDLEMAGISEEEEEEERRNSLNLQNTITRTTTQLKRQRTDDEILSERRQVYGPSIPPFA
jgi:hypothetical protein